ncbi:MAG TPA: TRAP transporter small permease [Burkholderiaceae bacterium]|nr:TRAP transporter small permease [Burkholderiaceae bacterium]
MVALLVAVLLSITGRQLGFNVPGIDSYAGFLLAASGFLSLAHTLKRGEHIRVTLLLNALHAKPKRGLELWTLVAGVLLSGLFAFYAAKLAWQSSEFNDVSTGNDATPLWIPQLSMAVGAAVLLIAMLDELILELRGKRVLPVSEEATRNE